MFFEGLLAFRLARRRQVMSYVDGGVTAHVSRDGLAFG